MTKDLLNGIAITFFIALSIFIPVLGLFFVLFIPLPTFYYRLKLGRQISAVIPLTVIFTMGILGGGMSADTLFLAELLIIGFSLGEFTEKNFSIDKSVALTSGVVLLSFYISMLFYSLAAGGGLFSTLSQYIAENLEKTIVLYKEMNMPEETIRLIEAAMPQITYVLIRIIPGMMVAFTLIAAWINLLTAKAISKMPFPGLASGRLNHWKAPESLVWVAIGAGLAMLIPSPLFKVLGLNVLLVLMVIYFFQGIAVIAFLFEKKGLPKTLRIVLYGFIAIQQLLIFVVIGLGFFDVWLDARKLNPKAPGEG